MLRALSAYLALQASIAAAPDVHSAAKSVNAFTFDLYSALAEQEGNLFVSPFSISTALSMTQAGARGETAREMAAVLHLPEQPHAALPGLLQSLRGEGDPPYELDIANSLWLQDSYHFEPEFLRIVEDSYGAGLFTVDYAREAEAARRRINEWVEEQTRDKIEEVIGDGMVDSSTRLVLVNAIYFKGEWETAFDPTRTQQQDFRVSPARSVKVPMMERQGNYRYGREKGYQVVELPYRGDHLSMVILLPDAVDGLADLEQKLEPEALSKTLAELEPVPLSLSIPKFKAASQFELNRPLTRLGMGSAFGASADFSGMTGSKELFISVVVHKAYVDVNEEGTEAAAATGVAMTKSALAVPKAFRADHPFLYLIRDMRSGAILFLGRLTDPSDS